MTKPISDTLNGPNGKDRLERASKLSNAVEALVNILYLIENNAHAEHQVRQLVSLAGSALDCLKEIALGEALRARRTDNKDI